LTRLKNDGLLDYDWKESKTGPPRKYYKITDQGKSIRDELINTWQELSNSVNSTISEIKK